MLYNYRYMYNNFRFELNDFLIRKHLKKYDLEGGYYDILIEYPELMETWDNWYMGYLDYMELKKHNGW